MKLSWTSIFLASLLAVPAMVRSDDPAACVAPGGACCTSETAQSPATQPTRWVAYGEPMKLTDKDNIDAGAALANLEKYDGKVVRLTGTVQSVCAKKGCWLKMTSNGSPLNVYVKFTCPIDGRLIPVEAVNKPVVVEGVLAVTTISEAEAQHIAEDAGKSEEEVNAIVGDQPQIEIQGPSALVGME